MTAETVGAELFVVRLLVTREALAAQTEERPVDVFQLDLETGCGCDFGRGVATVAFLCAMLAFQGEACLGAMVECLSVQRNEFEFRATMLRMTARTIRFARRAFVGARMEASAPFYPMSDFNVTFETFQTARSKIVARSAPCDAVEVRVRARQRTWGYLRPHNTAVEQTQGR